MNHRTTQIGEEIVRRHKVDVRKKSVYLFWLRQTGKIIITIAGTLKILR